MDTWAKAPPKDREALFNQTASVKGISPEIVEKDFWVCWILHHIFHLDGLPRLMFKGGTSLSKAFALIKRFSEDLDLVINRHQLGFSDKNDPANQQSSSLRDRTIERLKTTCRNVIAVEVVPKFRDQLRSILRDNGWTLEIEPNAPGGESVEFKYPAGIPDSFTPGYIKRSVRLEFGCRGDQVPCEDATVTPYAAEAFPDQFQVPGAKVSVVSPERTFWEKATILHCEYHGVEAGKKVHERLFRHYHDVVALSKNHRGVVAMKDFALLEQVVAHKRHFFRDAAAHYELAKKGTLRLAPSPQITEALRRDYSRMREMYFDEAPDFDAVINEILKLEKAINEL